MTIYADTSFFLPHYVADRHSPEVDRRMRMQPRIFLTPFHRAEIANAIYQQVFQGKLVGAQAAQVLVQLEQDCASIVWEEVELPANVYEACFELARRHVGKLGVRTLDTLHVAAAVELGADVFWSFDQRQVRLAEAVGLAVQ